MARLGQLGSLHPRAFVPALHHGGYGTQPSCSSSPSSLLLSPSISQAPVPPVHATMAALGWLANLFRFRVWPVSVVTLLVYGAIFTAVLVTDQTPSVPKDLHGLDLDQSYRDLHKVSFGVLFSADRGRSCGRRGAQLACGRARSCVHDCATPLTRASTHSIESWSVTLH